MCVCNCKILHARQWKCLHLTLKLRSDNQLDNGGKTHVTNLQTLWGKSVKWRQKCATHNITIPQSKDLPWTSRAQLSFSSISPCFSTRKHVCNNMVCRLPWIRSFGHSCDDSPIVFTCDCATRAYYWRITPLVKTSLFNPYDILSMHAKTYPLDISSQNSPNK